MLKALFGANKLNKDFQKTDITNKFATNATGQ
jgi:hypothetical protein